MIYLTAHKPFQCPEFVNNSNYTIITDGTDIGTHYPTKVIKANNELAPMKYTYSEGFQIYDIWINQPDYEWIGINHYRRYFKPDEEFEKINILPKPMQFNVRRQYAACHNVEDYDEIIEIINKYYPEMNTNLPDLFFPCNCCILTHDIFNQWCDFIFNCTFIFNERHHLYSDDDVAQFVNTKPKNGIYQNRLHGFLLERLSTIFFLNYFNKKPTELRCKDLIMYDVPALQQNVK